MFFLKKHGRHLELASKAFESDEFNKKHSENFVSLSQIVNKISVFMAESKMA